MAILDVVDGQVVVELSALEKIGALHGNVIAPLSKVTNVRVTNNPFSEIRGIRCPGTGFPRVIMLGTVQCSIHSCRRKAP